MVVLYFLVLLQKLGILRSEKKNLTQKNCPRKAFKDINVLQTTLKKRP